MEKQHFFRIANYGSDSKIENNEIFSGLIWESYKNSDDSSVIEMAVRMKDKL